MRVVLTPALVGHRWVQVNAAESRVVLVGKILHTGAIISAFVSAYFWFRAANVKVPDTEDWNAVDPQPWLTEAAKKNRMGAIFAGLSALLFGIAEMT